MQRFWDHHLDALHAEVTRQPEEKDPHVIEIVDELNAIHRRVQAGADTVGVLLRRSYPATPDEVWDAVADPERLRRWFLPVTGELKVGGSFQLEGNAGGEILECEPPRRFSVTFGGPESFVEVQLTEAEPKADPERTTLQLTHTVPIAMAGSGAGALFVGPGWDGVLLALGLYFAGEAPDDPVAAASSPEVIEFSRQSVQAWVEAVERSGTASADEVAQMREMSLAQFAPTAS